MVFGNGHCQNVRSLSGERFTPGIGHVENDDELKREIMHQLCIRPMAHSELVKALPENVSELLFTNDLV